MRILIDTNVLIDFLQGRMPHLANADKIIKMCVEQYELKDQGFW